MSSTALETLDHRDVFHHTRVALVTWSMPGGGVEMYLLRLGRFLASHGQEVEIIVTESPGKWFSRVKEAGIKATYLAGFNEHVLPLTRHAMRVASYLTRGNYDFVFVNGSRSAQALLTMLPDHTTAIPVLHGDDEFYYHCYLTNRDAWNLAIGVSPQIRNVAAARVPNRPIIYLANGVDMPTAEQWQVRQPWSSPLQVLFVGRVQEPFKGVHFMPEVVKGCVERGIDLRFTVIGDGPDLGMMKEKIDAYGLSGITNFLGFLPPKEVYTYLLNAHVFLLTSEHEGLPTVVLEASGCGCVPVSSLLPGITDVAIENGKTGLLVEVGDVGGFVQAVERLFREPDTWQRMSRAAHEKTKREFSVEAMGERYLAVMANALAGHYPLPHPRRHRFPIDFAVIRYDLALEEWLSKAMHRLIDAMRHLINFTWYNILLQSFNWVRYEVIQRYWIGFRDKIVKRGRARLRKRLQRK